MCLYKFVTASRIEDILAGWIRFTQPGAFNDPFEIPAMKLAEIEQRPDEFLNAALEQTRDIQAALAANPLQVPAAAQKPVMFYWGKKSAAEASTLTEEERDRRLQESKEKIREIDERFGILSLSQGRENFLLWAHYADEHRGAVFELDVDDPNFSASYEAKGGVEKRDPVRYVRERPKLPLNDQILQEHFFNKSPHWKYEAEFRIVRDLIHHDNVKNKQSPYPVYLFRLPPSCIRSITLGVRFDEAARDKLAERIKTDSTFKHVALAQTKLDPQHFDLTFEPLTTTD